MKADVADETALALCIRNEVNSYGTPLDMPAKYSFGAVGRYEGSFLTKLL